MSGTRLRSRKAPATEAGVKPALLIVAHGERGGLRQDRLSHGLVGHLRATERYRDVQACFISKEPTLKSVVAGLSPGPAVIYPLFMSDGYFVMQAIPKMLEEDGNRQIEVAAPVGLSPGLPQLVADHADGAARAAGLSAEDNRLLLVAHGSKKDPASRNAAQCVAAGLSVDERFAGVELAFLEESPFLDDKIETVGGPAVVVGLFTGEGLHGGVDLPQAVEKSGRADIVLSPPLARSPALMELICEELSRMMAPTI